MKLFRTLSASRTSNGFGFNPLALGDIVVYLSIRDLLDSFDDTIKIIQEMDQAYLELSNKDNQ